MAQVTRHLSDTNRSFFSFQLFWFSLFLWTSVNKMITIPINQHRHKTKTTTKLLKDEWNKKKKFQVLKNKRNEGYIKVESMWLRLDKIDTE